MRVYSRCKKVIRRAENFIGKEWLYKSGWLDVHATSLAFYLLLAIVPMLILVMMVATHFNATGTREALEFIVANVIPSGTEIKTGDLMRGVELGTRSPAWIVLASLAALWTASTFMTHVSAALRQIFAPGIKPPRMDWLNRWYAFALLLGWAVILCVVSLLYLLAPLIEEQLNIDTWGLKITRQGLSLLAMFCAFWFTFKMLSASVGVGYRHRAVLRAALIATLGWVVFGWLYSVFLVQIWQHNPLYGTLGGFIATLLWAYFSCWVILLAACVLSISGKVRKRGGAA
ncbi:MAG: YihY/virulence factor BrkB family protein [Verrucomicrobiales bacterium]|jgi:membrane protein|nr:YihY/virulence factor BrkB family protein [Verrucomicrobiales bacterium]